MYNLIQHSNNYEKTIRNFMQYYIAIANDEMTGFESLKFKARITETISADGNIKDVEVAALLLECLY